MLSMVILTIWGFNEKGDEMKLRDYLLKLEEEQAFLYFHLKPMDEEQHSKWINHIFYLIKQQANQIFDEHEAHLKAKDEEIKELKDQLSTTHNIMYLNGYSDAIDCYDTFGKFNIRSKPNAKARSIVAMLFWEWRKWKRWVGGAHADVHRVVFEKAYAMLKDNA